MGPMESIRILFLSVAASILYGILHDQVTARVCVEYFTIGHPPIFHTESPTLLAFGWGILATWWVGVMLGIPLALCARAGDRPALTAKELVRPIAILLGCMATLALAAGIGGYLAARSGLFALPPEALQRLPAEKHAAFIADFAAHLASYASGFAGGIVLCAVSVVRRRRRAIDAPARG